MLQGHKRNTYTQQKTLLINNHYDLQLMATQAEYRNVSLTHRMGDKEAKAQPQLRSPTMAEDRRAVRHRLHKLGIHESRGPPRRNSQVLAKLTNATERPL